MVFPRTTASRTRRRRGWRALIAVVSIAAIGVTAGTAAARVFDPQAFTLDNGLRVVVISDPRVPVVSHMAWYLVGSADEEPGRSGLAHLLEHLMFKGTPDVPQGEFSAAVTRNGGQENAFTSQDFTAYFQNIAKDRLELVMRMEADRMRNLTLNDAQVEPEKRVVLEERRQRIDNDPGAILGEEAQAVRFLNHPYRKPIIGWEHEIAALTTADVIDFYQRWYTPNNAVVVISGDVTRDEVEALARRTYGAVPKGQTPQRPMITEPAQRAERIVELQDPRVRQPLLTLSWPAASYGTSATADTYALQVLADALGGGATSQLYRKLVVERPVAISASAWYDPLRRGPSTFDIAASPRPGVSLDQLESAIREIVGAVVATGVPVDDVERSRQHMLIDVVFARDSYTTASRVLGQALAVGRSINDVEDWPERIAAVTPAEVDDAARAVFGRPSVIARLSAPAGTEDDAMNHPAPAASSTPINAPVNSGIR
ncbi:MAG: insulinase family protein [Rhodospirillales bacterium]|nr:insulinase family protein [Rhodospirillales bacterium]